MLTKDIISAIRRVYSETVAQEFKASKIIEYKKVDGNDLIMCDHCKEVFFTDEITVHHTIPVIPAQITHRQMSYKFFYDRLFCSWKHLQTLCLDCHREFGYQEDENRKYWVTKKKQLVCRSKLGGRITVNPVLNLEDLDPKWEVIHIATTRRLADAYMRKWRKR